MVLTSSLSHVIQRHCVNCARNQLQRRKFSGAITLCAKDSVRRERVQKEREETTFEYATKNTKRATRVYGWGLAETGALGIREHFKPLKGGRERHFQVFPQRVVYFDRVALKVVNGACGYGFTLFVCVPKDSKKTYQLYGTGVNTDSQLGYHEYPHGSGRVLSQIIEPVLINLPLENRKKAIIHGVACGRAHSVIHTSEGVFSLGNNAHGQCGRRVVQDEVYSGSEIINRVDIDTSQVKQVECGQDHTLFVMEGGEVFTCGLGSDGQTGQGHYNAVGKPTLVTGDIVGEKIVQVSSKADTVLALSDKGEVFGWGNTEYDQLSDVTPDDSQVNTSRQLPFDHVGRVTMVTAGGSTCAVLNDQGEVFVWGYGILGKGPRVDSSPRPTRLPPTLFGKNEFNAESKVKAIQAGLNYLTAINTEGELYSWGKNRVGSLGLGDRKDQFFPFKVLVPADTHTVLCGIDHTIALAKSFV